MPAALALPLMLRAAAAIIFLVAVIAAGIMNRSVFIVPLLAVAATLTQFLVSKIIPSPLTDLKAGLNPQAPPTPALTKLTRGVIIATFGYGILFVFTVFISALFQETELAHNFTRTDLYLIAIPAIGAAILSLINARIANAQMATMMSGVQAMYAQMNPDGPPNPANDDDAFTIDGEIIDEDGKPL